MFSAKRVNKGVVDLYKDQPYIETTIVIRNHLERGSELWQELNLHLDAIQPTMAGLNDNVEEAIQNILDSDVLSIQSAVVNLFKGETE